MRDCQDRAPRSVWYFCGSPVQELSIDVFCVSDHGFGAEVFQNVDSAGSAHLLRPGWIFQEVQNPAGKAVGVPGRHEPPMNAVPEEFGDAADSGGNNRFAQQHGFQYGVGQSLGDGREEGDTAQREDRVRVVSEAEESDAVPYAQMFRQGFEC